MEAVLGNGVNVVDKNGDAVALDKFTGPGKYVGVYFSAHWCPPCQDFTPLLAEFYEFMKATPEGANMEIVFISSDKDETQFKEYFAEMPWLALDFNERDRKREVAKKYDVRGIPTFIVFNGESGEVINDMARNEVAKGEANWEKFPWPRK